MKLRTIAYAAVLLLCLLQPFAASAGSRAGLAPFDEAPQDAGFLAFRQQLLQTIERRDVDALTAILDEEILNSFGGSGGIAEFHEMWQTASPDSRLWATLKRVLDYGGCLDETDGSRRFMAPYVWCMVVKTDLLEGYDSALVMKKGAPLLAGPSEEAEVLQRLGHEVVRIVTWDGEEGVPAGFYKVETRSGKPGWMRVESVRPAIGYRAIFEERDGRWVMTIFVAGD